ncbi:hypothetical protein M9435_004075 [Picochlorum sp. BPE23]|nr:hypothetical protein M9435_004075 [Picochlorum sp. BPE23]
MNSVRVASHSTRAPGNSWNNKRSASRRARLCHSRHGAIKTQCAGFGGSTSGKNSKKAPKLTRYLDIEEKTQTSEGASDGWFKVPDVSFKSTFLSKPIKAVILESGRAICLYKVNDTIYCTDANSTAFKYPLADASILQLDKTGPAVEVKLDGTVYDLATGKVMSWCPKNNPIRSVLGSLKDKSEPEDLPVFPVQVKGDDIWVNLSVV